jgi:16S rRNA (cytosine967-C5)-methyltransferase
MGGLNEARDRGLLTDLVYGTLRHQLLLDACLAPRLSAPDRLPSDVRNALRLASYELLVRGTPAHAAVAEWVSVVKELTPRLAGLVNAVLRRVSLPNDLPWNVRRSLPEWLAERFRALLGEEADAAAAGMLAPEPLWLSVHHPLAADALTQEGCEVRDGPVPGSLAVRSPLSLGSLRAFREGMVQPQNPSSRLPVMALGAVSGERVLDLAAGNGIKSAQLAREGARVTAVEIDQAKAERAAANLDRLGLGGELAVEQVLADLRRAPALAPAARVLLDAPCSGTGTLRGNPEIKLRLSEEDLSQLAQLQSEMLDSAAELTAPGGTLVYSVCALTPEEGPEQAELFLARHPGFEPQPLELPLAPTEGRDRTSRKAGPGRLVLPVAGLDGFFIVRLRRAAG